VRIGKIEGNEGGTDGGEGTANRLVLEGGVGRVGERVGVRRGG